MKRAYLSILCILAVLLAGAQDKQVDGLQLKEAYFDFGRIPQGKPVTHNFAVLNTGKEPLLIDNVQASCGCTTPEWSKEAIPAGGSSIIKVGYNAATEGAFEKSITVLYNKGQAKTFTIRGYVWKVQDQAAPKNSSVSLLKNVN